MEFRSVPLEVLNNMRAEIYCEDYRYLHDDNKAEVDFLNSRFKKCTCQESDNDTHQSHLERMVMGRSCEDCLANNICPYENTLPHGESCRDNIEIYLNLRGVFMNDRSEEPHAKIELKELKRQSSHVKIEGIDGDVYIMPIDMIGIGKICGESYAVCKGHEDQLSITHKEYDRLEKILLGGE